MNTPARVRIVTDSISDLPAAVAAELGIAVVPATIIFGADTYLEGVSFTREEFYDRLIAFRGLPKTAAPGPGAFAEAYQQMIEENRRAGVPLEGIISLHPPAALSGLYNSAFSASQLVAPARVEVVDSGQITMGVGWQAIIAARAAAEGRGLEDILALVKSVARRSLLIAGLQTLEWAARSGRVNRLVAMLGNMLAVKPILTCLDGELSMAERVRTHGRQVERVVEMAQARAPLLEVAVVHARAPDVAAHVADRLCTLVPRQRMIVTEIGCALGSYAGPGAYGIALVRAEPPPGENKG
jgi:DegV family protein with EDD domain